MRSCRSDGGSAPGAGIHTLLCLLRPSCHFLTPNFCEATAGGRHSLDTAVSFPPQRVKLLQCVDLCECSQLSEARAAHIDNALLATIEGGRLSSVASLQLQVRLLHAVRPENFGSFRSFARWQQTTATMLSSIATWSAEKYRQREVSSILSTLITAHMSRSISENGECQIANGDPSWAAL